MVGIARDPAAPLAQAKIATQAPAETLGAIIAFLREAAGRERIAAIGIASFGPLDLQSGRIVATPKPRVGLTSICAAC